MQDRDGHFYYRMYPVIRAKAPMLHWAQATTYRALTILWCRLTEPGLPLNIPVGVAAPMTTGLVSNPN
jgi:hypothetical protein